MLPLFRRHTLGYATGGGLRTQQIHVGWKRSSGKLKIRLCNGFTDHRVAQHVEKLQSTKRPLPLPEGAFL